MRDVLAEMPPTPCADAPALFDDEHARHHERSVRALCVTCPIYWTCHQLALDTPVGTIGGFLGGLTERQRADHQRRAARHLRRVA